jgi:hypothetical protein
VCVRVCLCEYTPRWLATLLSVCLSGRLAGWLAGLLYLLQSSSTARRFLEDEI